MAEELNATCDICGTRYHRCHSCSDMKTFQPWRAVTDTFNHYAIFLALSEYTKIGDKKQAKERLKDCDLTGRESFNENIKKALDEIYTEEKIAELKQDKIQKTSQAITKKVKASTKVDEVEKDDIE